MKELRFFDAQKRRLGESEVIVSSDIRLRHNGKSDEMAEKIREAILRRI